MIFKPKCRDKPITQMIFLVLL